jgi:hypothetical protein
MRIGRLVALLVPAILVASAAPRPAHAARHFPPTQPPSRGTGRIIPVLEDGTIREPCIDRAESIDTPDSLATWRATWEATLVGGSTNRLGTIDQQSAEAGGAGASLGLPGDAIVSARTDAWERTRLDAAGGAGSIDASGFGATTLALKKAFRPRGAPGTTIGLGTLVRIAGSADGPGPNQSEWAASLIVDHAFGERTHVAAGVIPARVGDTADSGHHMETSTGLAVHEDIADPLSLWIEALSVSSDEAQRPWLGVLDGGVRLEAWSHVDLTVGAAAGRGSGRTDRGVFARLGVHS